MLRIQAEALTFDDVSLVPAHSTVLPKDVSLATRLTRDLRLNLPIVSAAMDTVTEARLADHDGATRRHRHHPQEHDASSARPREVRLGQEVRGRRHPRAVHRRPGNHDRRSAASSRARATFPACRWSTASTLVGIVTSRDMRFEKKLDDPVRHIMTKKDRLVTVREGATDDEVHPAAAQAPHREGAGRQRRVRSCAA